MPAEKDLISESRPDQGLTDLDHALNHIAAAMANLHEAAQYLKNCEAPSLTQHIIRAREEICKSWKGLQQVRGMAK
jgi:hypothetical protein